MENQMQNRVVRIESDIENIKGNVGEMKQDIREIRGEVHSLRWWILGTALASFLGLAAIMIAFGQYQASWFQHSLDRNWEIALNILESLQK